MPLELMQLVGRDSEFGSSNPLASAAPSHTPTPIHPEDKIIIPDTGIDWTGLGRWTNHSCELGEYFAGIQSYQRAI